MPPRRNPSRKVKKTATGSETSPPLSPKLPEKPTRKAKKATTDTSADDAPVSTSPGTLQGPFTTEVAIDSRLNPIDLTRKSPSTPHKNTATSSTTPRRTSLQKKTSHVVRRYWTTGPLDPTKPFYYSQTHPTLSYFPHPGPIPTDPNYDPANPQHTATARRRSQRVAPRASPITVSFGPDSPPRLPTSPQYPPNSPPYEPISPQYAPSSPPFVWPRSSSPLPKVSSFSSISPPSTQAAASFSPTSPAYTSPTSPQYSATSPEYRLTSPEYSSTSARSPARKTSRGPMYSSEYPARVIEYSLTEQKGPAVVVTTVSRDEPARSLEGGNGKRAGGDEGDGEGGGKRVTREAQRWRGGRGGG